jgi:hypothetical protein
VTERVTTRRPAERFARGFMLLAATAGLHAAGCAEAIGKRTASGAVEELRRQSAENPSQQPSRIVATNAVDGTLRALDTPEHRALIERMIEHAVSVATTNAVDGTLQALDTPEHRALIERTIAHAVSVAATTAVENTTRQLIADLGPDGRGPLAVSLTRTGEQMTSAMTSVATTAVSSSVSDTVSRELAALVPECAGPERLDCLQRRLQQTARVTASSFTTGVKDSIGWQVLMVVFALGAGGGVLGAWLWSLRHYRRRTLRMA